jgi:hypothetical protein
MGTSSFDCNLPVTSDADSSQDVAYLSGYLQGLCQFGHFFTNGSINVSICEKDHSLDLGVPGVRFEIPDTGVYFRDQSLGHLALIDLLETELNNSCEKQFAMSANNYVCMI